MTQTEHLRKDIIKYLKKRNLEEEKTEPLLKFVINPVIKDLNNHIQSLENKINTLNENIVKQSNIIHELEKVIKWLISK